MNDDEKNKEEKRWPVWKWILVFFGGVAILVTLAWLWQQYRDQYQDQEPDQNRQSWCNNKAKEAHDECKVTYAKTPEFIGKCQTEVVQMKDKCLAGFGFSPTMSEPTKHFTDPQYRHLLDPFKGRERLLAEIEERYMEKPP